MLKLLPKSSRDWMITSFAMFLATSSLILFSRYLVDQTLTSQFVIFDIGVGAVIGFLSLLGMWTLTRLSIMVIFGDIVALIYMFYAIFTARNDGWIDLTSLISFLFIATAGLATGVLWETVYRIYSLVQKLRKNGKTQ